MVKKLVCVFIVLLNSLMLVACSRSLGQKNGAAVISKSEKAQKSQKIKNKGNKANSVESFFNPTKKSKAAACITLQWPADGLIAPQAKSVVIAGRLGTPIKAAASGTVVYSGHGLKQYGNLLIVKHNEDFVTVYAHNQELKVKEGEQVTKGQTIALMGKSAAERVKLHFEVRFQGKPQDPLKFLPKI